MPEFKDVLSFKLNKIQTLVIILFTGVGCLLKDSSGNLKILQDQIKNFSTIFKLLNVVREAAKVTWDSNTLGSVQGSRKAALR
jgi:hypothetical protein